MQLYNALSGPELRELILKKVTTLLDDSGKFDFHLTYPNCQFAVTIQVHLPVTRDRNFELKVKVDENPLPSDVEAETIVLQDSIIESQDNPPDKIRDDNQMPVSVPEVLKHPSGVIEVADKKEVRTVKETIGKSRWV